MNQMGRVINAAVKRQDNGVKVARTVEYEETLSIDQVHGKLKAEEKNLEMYQNLVTQTEERIAQYQQILAEYYGGTEGQ